MKVIFLDRDGVINEDYGYVHEIENFVFKDGILSLLIYLKKKGFLFYIITNQSGISRGLFDLNDYNEINEFMMNKLKQNGIGVLGVSFCPHLPKDNCECRKPKPKMVNEVILKFEIDRKLSWFIGDKDTDIECSINAGISNTIKIGKKTKNNIETFNVKNIIEIINII